MKRFMMLFGLAILLTAAPKALTAQGGFVVITNEASAVQELSADDVSRMFFKRTTQWPNGETIVPVDLPVRARTRATGPVTPSPSLSSPRPKSRIRSSTVRSVWLRARHGVAQTPGPSRCARVHS